MFGWHLKPLELNKKNTSVKYKETTIKTHEQLNISELNNFEESLGQAFPTWGNVNESFVKPSDQFVDNPTTPSCDQYEQKSVPDIPLVKPIGEIDTVIR